MIVVLATNLINVKIVTDIALIFLLLSTKAITLTLSKGMKTAIFRIVAMNCHFVMGTGKLANIGTLINIVLAF